MLGQVGHNAVFGCGNLAARRLPYTCQNFEQRTLTRTVFSIRVDDIISSPIVKEAIINNSDCKILLDQRKYINKFEHIQRLLGLTEKEKGQILSINQANHPGRFYREVWIGLGGTCSAVYATEVSEEEYFTFTTEESEKLEVQRIAGGPEGSLEGAIRRLAEKKREEQKQVSNPK